MSLLAPTRTLIELPVADRVWEGTTVKQRARYTRMLIDQAADGAMSLQLLVQVTLHAATAEGGFGQPLSGRGISSYDVTLRADNTTAVVPASGAIAYIRLSTDTALNFSTGTPEPIPAVPQGDAWLAYLQAKPETLMLQGDFFCLLRDTQDVRIRSLIEHHIQQADAMGRFN